MSQIKAMSSARKYLDLWYGVAANLVLTTEIFRPLFWKICVKIIICVIGEQYDGIALKIASFMSQLFIGLRILLSKWYQLSVLH